MSKIITSLFLLVFSFSVYANEVADNEPINQYTHKLMSEALNILNSPTKEAKEAKLTKARALILANLDFESMARRALGSARNTLTPEQMKEYVEVYKNFVSRSYTNLIKDYNGSEKDITVVSTEHLSEKDYRVNMTIINNEQPINVTYFVRQTGPNSFKVFDVITEGISLVDSQQSDFVEMVNNQGFDKLMAFLKSKS